METAAAGSQVGAAAGAGVDPVSAIANAVGDLFQFGGKIINVASAKSKSYYDRLRQQGAPQLLNFDPSSQNMTLLYILIIVLVVLVGFIVFKKK